MKRSLFSFAWFPVMLSNRKFVWLRFFIKEQQLIEVEKLFSCDCYNDYFYTDEVWVTTKKTDCIMVNKEQEVKECDATNSIVIQKPGT